MTVNSANEPVVSSEPDPVEIERQKQQALSMLNDMWDEASDEGVSLDLLSHAALFQALSSLVLAYGEESVADLCSSLSQRVLSGDYTLGRTLQ